MVKLTKTEFVNEAAELVEKHFPKGECQERGEAMVLVADLLQYLHEKGLVEYDS